MAEITKELGRIPVTRGEYETSITYYKDNIVQYKRGSYQVVSESPIIGVPPTNDKNVVNPGWTLFAGTLDAQDVVNQVKDQETKSIQAVAAREAEILAKSDAAEVSFGNTGTSLSGTNVQDALKETDGKLSKLESEVIYDVTANNNGATFSSLSALLSSENLPTLIPTSVRHGGMSIRFVQSSDNKYVQYFLTKNKWSAIDGDWERMNMEDEVSHLYQELSINIAKLNSAPIIKQIDITVTSANNTKMTLLSGEKYIIQCSCAGADDATLDNSGLYYDYGSGYIKAFDADKSMFNKGFTCVLIPSGDTNLYVRTYTVGDVVDITLWSIANIEEKASKQESIFAAIASEAYSYSDLTYNDSGMPISGTIIWPDGREGGIVFYYNKSGLPYIINYSIYESKEKYAQEFSYKDDGSFATNTIYKVNN